MKYIIFFLLLTTSMASDFPEDIINSYHQSHYKLVISKKYNIFITASILCDSFLLKTYTVLHWDF